MANPQTAMDVLAWLTTGKDEWITNLFIRKAGVTTRIHSIAIPRD